MLFMERAPIGEAEEEWNRMLADLGLDSPAGEGWELVPLTR